MHKPSVVMVCTANQCRSPMAEYLLKKRLGPKSKWKVMSAGTFANDGLPASRSAIAAMSGMGIDISAHRSRAITAEMMNGATVVITMTRSHSEDIADRFPGAMDKVFTIGSLTGLKKDHDVTDPVGMSEADYRLTRDEIDEMMSDVVLFLREHEGE